MAFSGPPRDQLAILQIGSEITEFIQQHIFEIYVVLVLLILDLRDLTGVSFILDFQVSRTSVYLHWK